jgi:sugar/nucleoside kinase (ribokinase family)
VARRIAVLGTVVLDRIYGVSALPQPDDEGMVLSERLSYGGRGVVASMTMALLGFSPALLTSVGSDFASSGFEGFLRRSGVDIALLHRDDGDRCYATHIYGDAAGNNYTFFHPRKLSLPFSFDHAEAIRASEYLYVAINEAVEFDTRCIATAAASDVRIIGNMCNAILSSYGDDFVTRLVDSAEVLSCNAVEWESLRARLHLSHPRDLFASSRALRCVYVTDGGRPGHGHLPGSSFEIRIRQPVRIGTTAGAGDTFLASVTCGLANDLDYDEAAQLASELASIKTEGGEPTLQPAELERNRAEVDRIVRSLGGPASLPPR